MTCVRKISDLLEQYLNCERNIPNFDQLDAPALNDRVTRPAGQAARPGSALHAGLKTEHVIERIRSLPGFERFLAAPSEEKLKAVANKVQSWSLVQATTVAMR